MFEATLKEPLLSSTDEETPNSGKTKFTKSKLTKFRRRNWHLRRINSRYLIYSLLLIVLISAIFVLSFICTVSRSFILDLYPFDNGRFIGSVHNISTTNNLLIDTDVCQLKDYPLWDKDILNVFQSRFNQHYKCDKDVDEKHKVHARRINFTKIVVDELDSETAATASGWACIANEIKLNRDSYDIDKKHSIPLAHITDFRANNTKNKWDSVQIFCNNAVLNVTYKEVIPLVQDHMNHQETGGNRARFNVIMLGLDSISRLNMRRHLRLLNDFYQEKGFINLYGYHKVGENTFPNLVPMLSGYHFTEFYNFSMKRNFKWDNVKLLWKEFHREGYTTAFLEDMPPYAIFSPGKGGFKEQPTDYYTRPAQQMIWRELTNYYSCYYGRVEDEIWWEYYLDMLDFFKTEPNRKRPYFTFMHLSTLTHNYFNHAGYADLPYSQFFKRLFDSGHNENTVIFSFSDHSLRFGDAVDTDSNVHEAKLPYIQIYVPDGLSLDGKNAQQLRDTLHENQRKLTSHFDVHATVRHILYGQAPTDEKYGQSLFTSISPKRRCAEAGIKPQYCMCNSYEKLQLSPDIMKLTAEFALKHINKNILKGLEKLCVELTLTGTHRVFESIDRETKRRRWLVVFTTAPNDGIFEAIIDMDDNQSRNGTEALPQYSSVISTSRLSRYGSQSDCVQYRYDVEPYCYCKNLLQTKQE